MTAVSDSKIFGNIFSTPESAAIWSDTQRTIYYLQWEAALAKVQGELGIIPEEAASLIQSQCKIDMIDWDELRKQTEAIGYPVLPVVKQIVAKVNAISPGQGEYAHWGATTQDITDTTTALQLGDTIALMSEHLDSIMSSLHTLASEHKATPQIARSNLQHAVPQTFGLRMARLLATFSRHRERLATTKRNVAIVEFGGASGTLASLGLPAGKALECQSRLAAELGLSPPEWHTPWHTERDNIAEFGSVCALITSTCAKFAFDLKLLMQNEVGEASEPYAPHRGSSSTMPQKRNPIGCAYITSMNATVRQLAASLFEAMVEDHERSTGPWEIEWIVLPQIATLTCATMRQMARLVSGLEVHVDKMGENLDLTKGLVCSEAVMMALGPKVGRQKAHDLVYELCREAVREDKTLLEVLSKSTDVTEALDRKELEDLCEPRKYLGLSIELTDLVLNGVGKK